MSTGASSASGAGSRKRALAQSPTALPAHASQGGRRSLRVTSWCVSWNQISDEAVGSFNKAMKVARVVEALTGGSGGVPDVLLLQETPLGLLAALQRRGYVLLAEGEGMAVLAAERLRPTVLGSKLSGKGWVGVKVSSPDSGQLLLASLCLARGSDEGASNARKAELQQCVAALRSGSDDAMLIVAGDTNMRKVESWSLPELRLRDAWIEAGEDRASRFTFDSTTNRFSAKCPAFACRFDRVLVSSRMAHNAMVRKGEVSLVGGPKPDEAIGFHLAGHFGVSAVVRFEGSYRGVDAGEGIRRGAPAVCAGSEIGRDRDSGASTKTPSPAPTASPRKRIVVSAAKLLASLDDSDSD